MAYVIILVTKGTNAGMTDEQRRNVSGEELAARVLGAKCFITGWLCYAGTVWILKLCVGFFFQRITEGLPQQRFIKPAMGYVLATWVTTSLFLFLNCRPFHAYWQVDPNPGSKYLPSSTPLLSLQLQTLSFHLQSNARSRMEHPSSSGWCSTSLRTSSSCSYRSL